MPISVIYLLCAAGHRPDTDEIVPNLQDKIPLDLYFAIVCPILLAILFLILEGRNPLADTGALSFVVIGSIILAILGLATLLTCVTRLKLGRYFYQHTIAYQVIRFCRKMLAAVCSTIADAVKSISTTWKIAVAWLVISAFYTIGGFGAIVLSFALLLVFCSMASQMQELKNGGEELAKGNLNYKINTQRMFPLFRAHGKNLNSISKGFSIALEQKMKSEHLKTELITNVSHDIKTPLTSIINYVDLLKKENLDGQAAEYIEVLDRQSRRLKKLTEDLVEASKASTGNLKVQLAPTDMGELAAQAVAEYEEKLENAHLEAVINGRRYPPVCHGGRQSDLARAEQPSEQRLQIFAAAHKSVYRYQKREGYRDSFHEEYQQRCAQYSCGGIDGAVCARRQLPSHRGKRLGAEYRTISCRLAERNLLSGNRR